FGKFARRHRTTFFATSFALAALILGLVGTSWGLVSTNRARREVEASLSEARRQERIANQINAFLNLDVLAQADPRANPGDITVRDAVANASERLGDRFLDEPLVRAGILYSLGDTLLTLADFELAESHLKDAFELRRKTLGMDHKDTIRAASSLAIAYRYLGKIDAAIELNQRALAACRKTLPADDPEALAFINNLASLYSDQGRHAEALAASEQVADAMRRAAPGTPDLVGCLVNLSADYRSNQRDADALRVLSEAADICQRHLPSKHPYVSYVAQSQGVIHLFDGRFAEAERLFRAALSLRREVFPEDHPQILTSETNLALALLDAERPAEAEALLRHVYATRQRQNGDEHDLTLYARELICRALCESGHPREAIEHGEAALATRRRVFGEDHSTTVACRRQLAEACCADRQYEVAEPLFRKCLDTLSPVDKSPGAEYRQALAGMAKLLLDTDRADEAESLLRAHVENTETPAEKSWRQCVLEATYGTALHRLGRLAEAERILASAHERLREKIGDDHSRVAAIREELKALRGIPG
ncbi:MAG: tetratricopeptide repeat protein, partial [Phycisphaerales bacterium]|nr:tetratricopeptide repeat protein [Phycisphaerales bacterium]